MYNMNSQVTTHNMSQEFSNHICRFLETITYMVLLYFSVIANSMCYFAVAIKRKLDDLVPKLKYSKSTIYYSKIRFRLTEK